MKLRPLARNLALIVFAAVGCYLVSALVSARLALWFIAGTPPSSPLVAILLGLVAFDLAKIPALLVAARLIAKSISWGPLASATALVLATYGLEILVAWMLDQSGWLKSLSIVLCRGAAAALMIWLAGLVISRRRKSGGRPKETEKSPDDSEEK